MGSLNKLDEAWKDPVIKDPSQLTDSKVMDEILQLSPEKRPFRTPSKYDSPSRKLMSPMRRMAIRQEVSPYKSPVKSPRRTTRGRKNLQIELDPIKKQEKEVLVEKLKEESFDQLLKSPSRTNRGRKILQKELDPVKQQEKDVEKLKEENDLNSPRNIGRRILQHTTKCVADTIGALHSSIPDQLLERSEEREKISSFIINNAKEHKPKSLYVSGSPGTGKTACIMTLCNDKKVKDLLDRVIIVNCMSITSTAAIYQKLARELDGKRKEISNLQHSKRYIESQLSCDKQKMILVVLDEMDQLDSNEGDVLYQIFDWISLQNSRLILIGIANSLDLTDRVLPRLQVNNRLKPELLNFKPYSQHELMAIIESRLPKDDKFSVIDRSAVQLCARKVAAKSGDARASLDICRRAIELMTQQCDGAAKKVGISQICRLMATSSQNAMKNKKEEDNSLPMEQKLIICALFKIIKKQKSTEVGLTKLYEVYTTSCKQQGGALSLSDFVSICQSLEDRRIFDVIRKKNKTMDRTSKIKFAILESDIIESYFKGDVYFESILKEYL